MIQFKQLSIPLKVAVSISYLVGGLSVLAFIVGFIAGVVQSI